MRFSVSPFNKNSAHFITQLIQKNPSNRLKNYSEIKAHPWFKGLNWKKLFNLQITPPFIPVENITSKVIDPYNINNKIIDEAFLNERVAITDEAESSGDVKEIDDGEFEGFTTKGWDPY